MGIICGPGSFAVLGSFADPYRAGGVAELSKALVLGTSHFDGVGLNPTVATPLSFVKRY